MSDSVEMASLLEALEKQTKQMHRLTSAVLNLAKSTHALAEAVYADLGADEEDEGHGVDMAGNPIRAS